MYTPPVPLDADHDLQVKFTASGTHALAVRAHVSNSPDSPPRQRVLDAELRHSAGDRTTEITSLPVNGGFLWGFSIFARGELKRGEAYVEVFLSRFGAGVKLASGYVYANHDVTDGEFVDPGPGGGEGLVRSIDLGDPAAGADYADQTVPTNAVWELKGFIGTLVTSVNAANRRFTIRVTDGTVSVAGGVASARGIADRTNEYQGAPGLTHGTSQQADDDTVVPIGMPGGRFPEAFVVEFNTFEIDATDNWGDGQLLVEEWLVP